MAQVEYHPYITKNSPISAVAFLPTGLGVGVGGKWRTPQRSLQCQSTCRESQRTLAYCQEEGKKCFLALWSRKGGGKSKGGVHHTTLPSQGLGPVSHSQVGTYGLKGKD